jgi:hypothetical protein
MLIKDTDSFLGKTILLTVHLCPEAITRDKGDLHARKEGGEEHCYQQANDYIRHRRDFY